MTFRRRRDPWAAAKGPKFARLFDKLVLRGADPFQLRLAVERVRLARRDGALCEAPLSVFALADLIEDDR